MWIICGHLEQDHLDQPWVIMDMDEETGELTHPMIFTDPDQARDNLEGHLLVEQSKGSCNEIWCLNLITGEVEEL